MRLPGFFIVGAPKSGTSAMHDFLRQHPAIFMPPYKEIHYFGSDLAVPERLGRDGYLECFAGWRNERIAGETSVYYLASTRAADEIRDFNADARVVIMLRNPVDAIYSLYHQVRFNCNETIESFEEALAAEPLRSRGHAVPAGTTKLHQLLYRRTVTYSEQVRRYFDVLGRERVHIILYDDFCSDAVSTYRQVLEFLDVDPAFRPRFSVINPGQVYRSRRLQQALQQPPPWLVKSLRQVVPAAVLRGATASLGRLNARHAPRAPMKPELRSRLQQEFAPEIDRLATLIDRDLSGWRGQQGVSLR